jgi:hypothetical protein
MLTVTCCMDMLGSSVGEFESLHHLACLYLAPMEGYHVGYTHATLYMQALWAVLLLRRLPSWTEQRCVHA